MSHWRRTFPSKPNLRPLRTFLHVLTVAALLAGLIPPPALTSLASSLLPTALAKPVEELTNALLPQPAVALAAAGEITGTVFRDYAADAVNDAGDPGIANIVVTAYDTSGSSVSTTTDASGSYTLAAASGTPSALSGEVRVEFTLPSDGSLDFLKPTIAGMGSVSSVQFADMDAGATVNAGFYNPADYCDNNPSLATSCYLNREIAGDTLVSWDYDNRGSNEDAGWIMPTHEATNAQIGSTWGLGYSRQEEAFYTASFLKRHASLPDHDSANGGDLGNIYKISADGDSTNNGAAPIWLNLDGATDSDSNTIDVGFIGDNVARGVNGTANTASADPTAFFQVGRVGLGDLEMSEAEDAVWVVNLFQKDLHRVAINGDGTAGAIQTFAIPTDRCNTSASLQLNVGNNTGRLDNWSGDGYYLSAYTAQTSFAGVNTSAPNAAPESVYRSYRTESSSGSGMHWMVPLPNGNYEVRLHFNESAAFGTRIFDVTINGALALDNFDIRTAAGGSNIAQIESINVAVTEDLMTIDLVGVTGRALINGIEIIPQSGQPLNDAQPFGLGVQDGIVYAGVTCSAEYSQDINDARAFLYSRPDDNSNTALSLVTLTDPSDGQNGVALNYNKGSAGDGGTCSNPNWLPWATTFPSACNNVNFGGPLSIAVMPQPLLSDIEFSADGMLSLGFIDRWGHQAGQRNYDLVSSGAFWQGISSGDLLRAAPVGPNSYQLENNGAVGALTGSQNNNQGPGGGEFYGGDVMVQTFSTHNEIMVGGLALYLPSGNIVGTAFDPIDGFNNIDTGGVNFLSNTDGSDAGGYVLYSSGDGVPPGASFGKAAGLGDLELLCAAAPIEIGNRVWWDPDRNGIQDGSPAAPTINDDQPIDGVTVQLYLDPDGNTQGNNPSNGDEMLLATTTTANGGQYYFSFEGDTTKDNANGFANQDWSGAVTAGQPTAVQPNTTYQVRIDGYATPGQAYNQIVAGVTGLNNGDTVELSVTDNGGADAGSDLRDTDVYDNPGNAAIAVLTGNAGVNDHTFDFAFAPVAPLATLQIVKLVSGGTVTDPFNVTVSGPNGYGNSITVTPGTPTVIGDLEPGSYTVVEESPISTAAPAGLTWFAPGYAPAGGTIALNSGETGTITVTNYLGAEPTAPTGILTVTKMVDWNGNTPDAGQQFVYIIEGPDGFTPINGTITDTGVMTYAVPLGVYTVTETAPGAGWVTTYTVSSAVSSTSGVVELTTPIAAVSPAALSGMVYHDYNSNGQLDLTATFTETGAAGIVITAYGPAGAVCGSTSSDANGDYSFTPTCDGPWRLSFSGLADGVEPSAQGSDNDTSTQFVYSAPATDLNFALNRPCDYCQSDPFLITPLYEFGAYNGGNATASALRGGQMSWGITPNDTYTSSEISVTQVDANGNPAPPLDFAEHNEIGATWGIAWNRSAEQLYMGAFIKAHSGLGPNGPGAIYQLPIDPATGAATAAPTLFADLAADGYTVCADPHGADLNSPPSPYDPVISAVGRCGLGDLDIAEDDATLYVVNLTSREIVAYDTATATPINDWAFPLNQDTLPANDGFCADPATDIWPFALEWHNGMLYVGATCTAMSTADVADLWGYVYRLDPATGQFTLVLNWDIDGEGAYSLRIPWRNSWATLAAAPTRIEGNNNARIHVYQAWLTDIAFYGEDLILGMRDRTGEQGGYNVPNTANLVINSRSNVGTIPSFISPVGHGDVVCAARTGVDQYTIEDANTGQCGDRMPGQAADGETGEFYMDGGLGHNENSFAGLELVPGFPLVQTIVNPTDFLSLTPGIFDSGGFAWADAADGRALRGYHLYSSFHTPATPGAFNKANGIGDVEALCDPAPIEIGNRIWDDYDGNGEQDAGEPGLNGLVVTLQTPTGISTTTTSGDGNWYFSVEPYTTYTITVATPDGYQLTAANAAALDAANLTSNHAISDTIDSDALLVNDVPTIIYTTGGPGQNNHGLDFGFVQPVNGQVDILNTSPSMPQLAIDKALVSPANGVAVVGDPIIFSLTISNTGTVTVTELDVSDTFDPNYLIFNTASFTPDTVGAGSLNWVGTNDGVNPGSGSLQSVLPLGPDESFVITVEFVATKP